MENLKTQSIVLESQGIKEEYQVREKDHGDEVVYDIFRKEHYLLTLAKDATILFMDADVPAAEKEIFNPAFLHRMIDTIQARS